MSKTVSRIAAVAALALAATPIIGLTAAAHAETVTRIPVGDLRLSNPADAQTFARRINAASSRACNGTRGLAFRSCRAAFAEDVKDALSDRHLTDLRTAQRAGAKIELAWN